MWFCSHELCIVITDELGNMSCKYRLSLLYWDERGGGGSSIKCLSFCAASGGSSCGGLESWKGGWEKRVKTRWWHWYKSEAFNIYRGASPVKSNINHNSAIFSCSKLKSIEEKFQIAGKYFTRPPLGKPQKKFFP